MADNLNTKGREANAAQDLGETKGLIANKDRDKTGAKERRSAGPDGPDSTKTFPGKPR